MAEPKQSIPKSSGWHPITWAIIGLAVGTFIVDPLVLSRDPQVRFIGEYLLQAFRARCLGSRMASGVGISFVSLNLRMTRSPGPASLIGLGVIDGRTPV